MCTCTERTAQNLNFFKQEMYGNDVFFKFILNIRGALGSYKTRS